jgi:hypothetical protein
MTYTICEAEGYWVVQTNRHGEQGAGIHVAYSWAAALAWIVETVELMLRYAPEAA